MKSIHLLMTAVGLLITSVTIAQIQSVSIQASGLTCSMCSRAIYKALLKVPAVSDVKEDIEHASYHVQFSDPSKVSPDKLQKAVTGAGFSVAWMEVKANFNNTEVASDSSLKINDLIFNFVDIRKQTLNGERELLIVDKDYLLEKDRKKYPGSYQTKPVAGDRGNTFHVTLIQS